MISVDGKIDSVTPSRISHKPQICITETKPNPNRNRVGLKSDGTTGQTTGHLAVRGSASRYMARRKATRQAAELTTV